MNEQSCNFNPSGNTLSDCFNKCQTNTGSDCLNYCNDICNRCSDPSNCKWIDSELQKNIDMDKSMYNNLTNDIILYQKDQSAVWNSAKDENSRPQIELVKNIKNAKEKRKILWNYLINEYNTNTQLAEANYLALKDSKKVSEFQRKDIQKNNQAIDSLRDLNNTKKRKIEINMTKYKSQENINNILFVACCLVLPAFACVFLIKKNILDKKYVFMIYGGYIFSVIVGCVVYWIISNKKRDEIVWPNFNYDKPDPKAADTDNTLAKMSSADKARCLAVSDLINEDNYDPKDIEIGNINKFINDPKKCVNVQSEGDFPDQYQNDSLTSSNVNNRM